MGRGREVGREMDGEMDRDRERWRQRGREVRETQGGLERGGGEMRDGKRWI